jgi:Domain of unknown function (DUF4349)
MTRSPRTSPARPVRAAAAVGALLLAGSLAACSGDSSSAMKDTSPGSTGSRAADGAAAAPQDPGAAAGDGFSAAGQESDKGTGSGTSTSARVLPSDRDVVYRGSITVQVRNVGKAADRAEALATGADGVVFSEQSTTDPRHPRYGQATLTLRVPPSAFGPTLDGLSRLGKELDRQRSAEDVTTQLTDVDSRVRSQQRSVDRVRVLLGQAKTIGEVVQVEAELSRREADLESLEAQLAKLKDVTDLATIEVTLVSPDRTPAPVKDDGPDLGFLTGLRGGLGALAGVALVAVTVLGALAPFALVVALLGVPAYLVLRTRRRATTTPPAAADA